MFRQSISKQWPKLTEEHERLTLKLYLGIRLKDPHNLAPSVEKTWAVVQSLNATDVVNFFTTLATIATSSLPSIVGAPAAATVRFNQLMKIKIKSNNPTNHTINNYLSTQTTSYPCFL